MLQINGMNHKDTKNGKKVNGIRPLPLPFFSLPFFVSLWFNFRA